MTSLKEQKKLAAEAAVAEFLSNYDFSDKVVYLGIGSGSTIVPGVLYLAQQIRERTLNLHNLRCIPTSFQAKQLIIENGLRLVTLEETPIVDVTIDGADEVDNNLRLIKGGGGCQTMEKIVAYASKALYIVCDETKVSDNLLDNWAKGIPIEVIPSAWNMVSLEIEKLLPKSSPILRVAQKKAGPVVTDNGNFILDIFPVDVKNWETVEQKLRGIPGVVATGLFLGLADKVFVGKKDGSVQEISN